MSFRFRENPCTALVSLRNTDDYNSAFDVHYLNKDVEKILPEGKFVFSLANGIESPGKLEDKLAQELVQKTTEAISHYLEDHTLNRP